MTRQEFIDEAKRRGKNKEEIRGKFEELDAAGRFDDSETKEPQATAVPETEKEGINISPEKASYVLGRKVEKPITIEKPEHPFEAMGVPKEIASKIGGAAYGFIKGGTLGAAKLIPAAREKIEKYEKEEPIATAAGEVASYFSPSGATKGIYKGAGKLVTKLPKTIGRIAQGGIAGGITGGVSEAIESKGDIKETAKAAGIGAATGFGTAAAMEGVKFALNKTGKIAIKIALPGTKTERAKGYKATNIHELNIGGFPGEILKKTTKEVAKTGKEITGVLKDAGASARFEVEPHLIKAQKNIYKIKETAGKEKGVQKAIFDIYESLNKRGLSNKELSPDQFRDAKSIVGEIAFPKGKEILSADPAKTQAAKMVYYNMMQSMNKQIPEVKPLNLKEHKLLAVRDAVNDAIERKEGHISFTNLIYWPGMAKLSQGAYAGEKAVEGAKAGIATSAERLFNKEEEEEKKKRIYTGRY